MLVAAGLLALVCAIGPRLAAGQQTSSATFEPVGAGLTGVHKGSSDWGDFDSDEDLDLVVTGRDTNNDPTARIYENNGDGGDLSDGLIAHYPFDGNPDDVSGNGNDGTLYGDP